ncbi:MAG: GNAT family N-acetyltransferase [Actinomycetota bacterium]|nr:GNAT family N-acetyltransferase [Actinomycetota bacterium]
MSAGLELRAVRPDEVDDHARAAEVSFGESTSAESVARWRAGTEVDRTRDVFDGDRIVATSGAFTFRLTVPGGGAIPASGITAVTVRSTHRRRGLLRRMMTALLDDAVDRGEAVAILTASEGAIYGRFGFGVTTSGCTIRLDRRVARLRPFDDPGSVELVRGDELGEVVREVRARHWRTRAGSLELTSGWFDIALADLESERGGASERLCAVHRDQRGVADGVAAYRLRPSMTDGNPSGTVAAERIIALDPAAHLALWRYLLSIDLMTTVEVGSCAVDDPIRWALTDPRHAAVSGVRDDLWLRPLDIAAMLGARSYRVGDDLVLDVADDDRPEIGGRFRLITQVDGSAGCARTDEPADVRIGVAELGALVLGGVAPGALARAGRLPGVDAEALRRLDLLFSWDEAPHLSAGF